MVQQEKIIKQNVIKDKFAVKEVNKLWSSDISEFKITGGKVYVCGIIYVARTAMPSYGPSWTGPRGRGTDDTLRPAADREAHTGTFTCA